MNFKRCYQYGSDWDKQYGSDKNVSIWSLCSEYCLSLQNDVYVESKV